MAQVVAVHGINNTYSTQPQMAAQWVPALLGGLSEAGHKGLLTAEDIACVSYGSVYRAPERVLGDDIPWYVPDDVEEEVEAELLYEWWGAIAAIDPAVVPPDERTLSLGGVRAALAALATSKILAWNTERVLIFLVKQVRSYLTDGAVHAAVQQRFAEAVGPDTRVVVAHSLGSVVAYEALCANPQWNITTLVTLGSPLGIRTVVFDRLRPTPQRLSSDAPLRGAWPRLLESWTNISDRDDIVPLVPKLAPLFGSGGRVRDIEISNGAAMHNVQRYLTARATGAAIAAGLTSG